MFEHVGRSLRSCGAMQEPKSYEPTKDAAVHTTRMSPFGLLLLFSRCAEKSLPPPPKGKGRPRIHPIGGPAKKVGKPKRGKFLPAHMRLPGVPLGHWAAMPAPRPPPPGGFLLPGPTPTDIAESRKRQRRGLCSCQNAQPWDVSSPTTLGPKPP